jgi:zinc protease
VILSEREGQENFAAYYLREEIDALAFKAHPYRYPVIGWKSDLRAITRDDLYRHYRTYYHPSNAVVIAAGDIEAGRMAELIGGALGGLPAGAPPVRTDEPAQEGERRVVLRRPGGGAAYVAMAFHVPAAGHADTPALLVLDGLLSGFKGPVPFDGGAPGRSSRLYRALVDTGLATEVGSGLAPSIDPTLFRISATVRAGAEVASVEAAILTELARIAQEPPGADELARVKRQAQAQFVYMLDGASRRAAALGAIAVVDRPEALFALPEQIEHVAADDVTRVASVYLRERARTVGWYLPEDGAPREVAA